ncbi:MAG TPA: glycosyltransferase [Longimicrobiaceae bacterium]|nr:glycosyltransferase [Longimicrobiaceae bacterium]
MSRSLKVAVHVDGPTVRGNERQVLLLAEELERRGHRVVASCRAGGPVREAFGRLGIRTTGLRPRGDLDAWSALRFAGWLRRERPDAALLTSWVRALGAGWAARAAGVPRVVLRIGEVHAIPPGAAGWKARRALVRYTDAVVANSRAVRDHLFASVPGLAPGAVYYVPNGVRLAPAPPAPLREELGIPAGAVVAAGVGGLERRKGFDLLVGALARAGDPGLHAVVAGEGPDRAALRALAESLGVADRVHLLGQRSDVAAVLAAADLFVLSSRSEGMSVAMLEAATARRPVVSTDVGGAWDVLAPRDGRPAAGWIVPRDDERALAGALREVAGLLRSDRAAVEARVDEAAWRLDNWLTVERMMDGVEAALLGLPWDGAGTGPCR